MFGLLKDTINRVKMQTVTGRKYFQHIKLTKILLPLKQKKKSIKKGEKSQMM